MNEPGVLVPVRENRFARCYRLLRLPPLLLLIGAASLLAAEARRATTVFLPKADFNNDGNPDWVLQNPATRQIGVWFMDDSTRVGAGFAPKLPFGWFLADADRFGLFGSALPAEELTLFNPFTRQTAFWILSPGLRFWGSLAGPTLPAGWVPVLSDFFAHGVPDLLLFQPSTGRTAVWYFNGTRVDGPTLPSGWLPLATADFDGDQKADLLLWNPTTRRTAVWYLNGTSFARGAYGPTLPLRYLPGALDDFNRDGKPDLVLWNPVTRQSAIWHLNNNVFVNGVFGPAIPAGWIVSAPR